MDFPEWKREHITIDFIERLPQTRTNHDVIGFHRFTHEIGSFLPISKMYTIKKLASMYLKEIVTRPGVPVRIISDIDARFNSSFYQTFQELSED